VIRLNISAEGFSEESFVKSILTPHLSNFNVSVGVRRVLTSRKLNKRGGIVGYGKFKNDVTQWFKQSPDAYHTTLIDLYGLSTDFPGQSTTKHLQPYIRIAEMERLLKDDLGFYRFIPYIQLHEFEALMFSDTVKLEEWLSLYNKFPANSFTKIRESVTDFNPELINEGSDTAPSKRILKLCKAYDKVGDGILILQEIGLNKLRSECAHFNEWLTKLEDLGK
jgi:hypothetical protein